MKQNIIFLTVCVAVIVATAIFAGSISSYLLGLFAGVALALGLTVPIGRLIIRRHESAQRAALKDWQDM